MWMNGWMDTLFMLSLVGFKSVERTSMEIGKIVIEYFIRAFCTTHKTKIKAYVGTEGTN